MTDNEVMRATETEAKARAERIRKGLPGWRATTADIIAAYQERDWARDGDHCRNNSHGILLGCWIRQHKWQRARDIFVSRRWQNVIHDLLGSPKDCFGTIGVLISIVSVFASLPLLKIK